MNNIILALSTTDKEALGTVVVWGTIFFFFAIMATKGLQFLRKLQVKLVVWNRKRVRQSMNVPHQAPHAPKVERKRQPIQYTPKPAVMASEPQKTVEPAINPYAVAGVPQALKNPPADFMDTTERLSSNPYSFPLGWSINGLVDAQFVGDVNHIALTGQSDSGKDNAALGILLSLALYHTPQEVQFALVDGKGLDWIDFEGKEHTWMLAAQAEEIPEAMQRLTAERKRRYEILRKAKVQKWDQYQGHDLPLLVVFVSELSLLEGAVGKKSELTDWLNAELTSARAFGIRYIIASQTMSNFDTRWRSQIGLYIAGYQPNASQDTPNCGFNSQELAERGTKAPSDLPVPSHVDYKGIFCVVKGRDSTNVRTAYISPEQRTILMNMLPDKPVESATDLLQRLVTNDSNENELQTAMALSEPIVEIITPTSDGEIVRLKDGTRLSVGDVDRIVEAAKTAKNRSALSTSLYGVAGGAGYAKVKSVCDHYGIL